MAEHYEVGDIVKLKKPHPCGSKQWKVLRTGMDFKLSCTGCGHEVWFVQGREELLARDRSAFDHEVGHGVLGIGRIEITQDNGAAVVETENKVIAGTFQRCLISREVEVDSAVPGRLRTASSPSSTWISEAS